MQIIKYDKEKRERGSSRISIENPTRNQKIMQTLTKDRSSYRIW